MFPDSVESKQADCIPQPPVVYRQNLTLCSVLVQGTFSTICEVRCVSGADTPDSCNGSLQGTYAMKSIAPPSPSSPNDQQFLAARSLQYEASILSQLDHPNIIRIRGIAVPPIASRPQSFILLDMLSKSTLEDRLDLARYEQQGSSSFFFKNAVPIVDMHPDGTQRALNSWTGKLKIATEVAHAMRHLHSRGIVYRNLNPSHVGFDATDGSVKLFDFGSARTLQEYFVDYSVASVSPSRYTAPEDILCQPSGYPSDVYSFGILLFELATLEKPYQEFFEVNKATKKSVFAQTSYTLQVALNNRRPDTRVIPCIKTKELIEKCWIGSPDMRPTFQEVASDATTTYYRHHRRKQIQAQFESDTTQYPTASSTTRGGLTRSSSFKLPPRRLQKAARSSSQDGPTAPASSAILASSSEETALTQTDRISRPARISFNTKKMFRSLSGSLNGIPKLPHRSKSFAEPSWPLGGSTRSAASTGSSNTSNSSFQFQQRTSSDEFGVVSTTTTREAV